MFICVEVEQDVILRVLILKVVSSRETALIVVEGGLVLNVEEPEGHVVSHYLCYSYGRLSNLMLMRFPPSAFACLKTCTWRQTVLQMSLLTHITTVH